MFDRILELGLFQQHKAAHHDPSVFLRRLLDGLLTTLSEAALDNRIADAAEFRKRVEDFRVKIDGAGHPDEIETASDDCLKICQDYLKSTRQHSIRREAEFSQVIDLLRQAIADLAGRTSDYRSQLIASSERFQDLTRIEDLRVLKQRITEEIDFLKVAAREKQKKDEESCAALSKQVECLQATLSEAQQSAALDSLTGIANRGGFDATLQRWAQLNREGGKFVLAILDVDDFKEVNDTHGHQIGDRMLQCAAKWLSNNIRATDFVARYGGDEFGVLLMGIQIADAQAKFSSLLQRIAASKYEYVKDGETREVRFTLSCGLAQFIIGEEADALVQRSDVALYHAKRQGKNRVVVDRGIRETIAANG